MMNNFVEAKDEALASRVILETIDKKLEDASKFTSEAKENANMNGKKKKKRKCRRVSVPLRLRLFSDQLKRKTE